MNRTDAPKKQPVPFGVNGSREDLLPTTPAGDNQASYDAGFPPVTMILKAAGGLPPKGQDMNQILYELSAIGRWLMAGAINSYDAAFSAAIGGYPKGCEVLGDDGSTIYFNNAEANTSNPNTGGGGWKVANNFQPLNANLTALSSLTGAANRLPYFTGAGVMSNTDLTAAGRGLINKADVAAIIQYLGLTETVTLAANALPKTGTAAAATKLATARTINGVLFDGTANITIPTFGAGTWTDVTASRTTSTLYTNTTGSALIVCVYTETTTVSQVAAITGFVNSIQIYGSAVGGGSGLVSKQLSCLLIVPPGATYSVGTSNISVLKWSELR